ncbi:hypothetical protein SCORR_v1c10240 (plasmid) [Spiroplasma corruscae]|uniref:DUF3899 domain-containing protein n=1 Tax=Spiroplasma corruscae TaxID=216934 RepID=A0A222EQU8_9MOLU|nr:hypothetical protein SCORR_v1c10240 [Spiroplasma corruscae]
MQYFVGGGISIIFIVVGGCLINYVLFCWSKIWRAKIILKKIIKKNIKNESLEKNQRFILNKYRRRSIKILPWSVAICFIGLIIIMITFLI